MSTSGVLGKVIPLDPALTIFVRCTLAGLLLLLYIRWRNQHGIKKQHLLFFIGSGILLAVHWTTYFQALKLGGVAVGMLSLFTYPVITSLIEPWILKTKHSWLDIGSSVLILLGLALIVPEFSLSNQVVQGAMLGVLSAIIYSFRNLWNKKHINTYSGSTIMCYQLLVSAVVLLPAYWTYPWVGVESWWLEMLILVVITTAVAHTLFVQGLKHFTTSSISIMSSLIPVYGVIWALIFTDESLTTGIIVGGLLIVATTALQNIQYLKKVI